MDELRDRADSASATPVDVKTIDAETVAAEHPRGHRIETRLWLRLLTCATLIEDEVRARLRARFGVTLPQFDLMAQLARAPDGLTMSALSGRLMVTNGNLTALTERLTEAGLVIRRASETDRRVAYIALTAQGRQAFAAMAAAHADWMGELMAGVGEDEIEALMPLLAKLKASARAARGGPGNGPASGQGRAT
jgi:DNA-binding MarR family transcriptional regulator